MFATSPPTVGNAKLSWSLGRMFAVFIYTPPTSTVLHTETTTFVHFLTPLLATFLPPSVGDTIQGWPLRGSITTLKVAAPPGLSLGLANIFHLLPTCLYFTSLRDRSWRVAHTTTSSNKPSISGSKLAAELCERVEAVLMRCKRLF